MQFDELLKLIDRLETSSIRYVDYSHAGDQVILSKEAMMTSSNASLPNIIGYADAPTTLQVHENLPVQSHEAVVKEVVSEETVTEIVAEGETVLSPMVGVAYLQANPDADAFVKVGDSVEKGDVIVLIEAMKLMNEIQAPKSGVVTEILIENEAVVEFNQPLVRIK